MTKRNIINALCGGFLGFMLGEVGIYFTSWSYWLITLPFVVVIISNPTVIIFVGEEVKKNEKS